MTLPAGVPSLDLLATGVARQATPHLDGPLLVDWRTATRPPLTTEEKREVQEAVKAGAACRFCAGIHPGASSPACPRLASGKVNGDGDVVEFTFWASGLWDTSRVVFLADVEQEDEDEGTSPAGDGDDRP